MDIWNIRNLKGPRNDFCSCNKIDIGKLGDVSHFVQILSEASKEFGQQNVLWAEVKLFQAIKRRIALTQRCDKFLKILLQVDHCIKNLVQRNMSKVFCDLIKSFTRNTVHSSSVCLPSRQQLEFVLIQCQGVSKLLCRTQSYIFSAFSYLIQSLAIGHNLHKLLMLCAVVSRIGIMLRYLLRVVCDSYKELIPWLSKFKEGKWKWEQSLNLPEDLWVWLSPEELKMYKNTPSSAIVPFLGKIFDAQVSKASTPVSDEQQTENTEEDPDLGEVVSRVDCDQGVTLAVECAPTSVKKKKKKKKMKNMMMGQEPSYPPLNVFTQKKKKKSNIEDMEEYKHPPVSTPKKIKKNTEDVKTYEYPSLNVFTQKKKRKRNMENMEEYKRSPVSAPKKVKKNTEDVKTYEFSLLSTPKKKKKNTGDVKACETSVMSFPPNFQKKRKRKKKKNPKNRKERVW